MFVYIKVYITRNKFKQNSTSYVSHRQLGMKMLNRQYATFFHQSALGVAKVVFKNSASTKHYINSREPPLKRK